MSIVDPASRVAALIDDTTALQRKAADPQASAWVSANAGTGKTHVLTQRVLRLLLAGAAPARILCLTYTKAAAAEMSKRVFETLAGWVGRPPDRLAEALRDLTGAPPDPRNAALARTLFTAAIETPGGFKVQTIHAFAERLLQRFPLEAGVPPAFTILDDHGARTLMREAIDDTLRSATGDRAGALGEALLTAVRHAADETFDKVLSEAVADRAVLDWLTGDSGDSAPGFSEFETRLKQVFDIPAYADADAIRSEIADVLDDALLRRLVGILEAGSKSETKAAESLKQAIDLVGEARIAVLRTYFLTDKGGPRQQLMVTATAAEYPDLAATVTRAQTRFETFDRQLRAFDAISATLALYRLAVDVRRRYQSSKSARAALDFEDLIARTSALLSTRESAAWVLYKLDGGIDHVLVDEAQDTSPGQWSIVGAIVSEFFSDTGAGADRTQPRTVFAVGDEKQSIYSFQGARPELFARNGASFETLARAAGQSWHSAKLELSFRTVAPILEAVDTTFADPALTPGVLPEGTDTIQHLAKRVGQGGLVEIWDPELPEAKMVTDAWSPLEEESATSPVVRLAERIAETIRDWLVTGELLASQARPVRAGDILILVRKRNPMAPAIVAALKKREIPVAGSDRIALSEQLAIQDLMALGDFLTLPEDDLALANVLKCPLLGLDDDDLLVIANGRRGTLWKALLDASATTPRFTPAAERLKSWRKQADFLPPFEFYAQVLDRDGGRMAMLQRLGPEAADPIDEFMNLALRFDDEAPPSLTGFLAWLREDERTIKRDMEQGRNEVRVLTVHGAKGLEAPIVFLPDTCHDSTGGRGSTLVQLDATTMPEGPPPLSVWPVKSAKGLDPIVSARAGRRGAEAEELNRLLYVALTRPRDRLYISGFLTRDQLPGGSWYDVVTTALASRLKTVTLPDGRRVRRLAAAQTLDAEKSKHTTAASLPPAPRPEWMSAPAPRESRPAIPFAPSRVAPYDFDDTGEPIALSPGERDIAREAMLRQTPEPHPSSAGEDVRFLRGTLTHALLEHLPGLPREVWPETAHGFLKRRGSGLHPAIHESMVAETLGILSDTAFAPLFAEGSRAEVPVVAELPDPSGRLPPLMLNGQIDRLAVTPQGVLIVDYKTNRSAPASISGIPEAHLLQLAAYRVALSAIFPGQPIRAALLWTQVPRLMEVPSGALDAYGSSLWALATGKLDLDHLAP